MMRIKEIKRNTMQMTQVEGSAMEAPQYPHLGTKMKAATTLKISSRELEIRGRTLWLIPRREVRRIRRTPKGKKKIILMRRFISALSMITGSLVPVSA